MMIGSWFFSFREEKKEREEPLNVTVYTPPPHELGCEELSISVSARQEEIDDKERLKEGKLLGNVTHELNNPLGVIKGNLGLLEQEAKGKKRSIRFISQAVYEMEELTRELSLLEGLSDEGLRRDFGVIDLDPLVREVIDFLEDFEVRKGVHLKFQLSPVKVLGNPFLLKIAFKNLIQNAIKYTPKGGEILVYLFEEDDKVVFRVQDEGIGIADKDLKNVLKRFFRSRDAKEFDGKGTGLGLAIVEEVTGLHKGRVGIESKLGEGSTFSLEFEVLKSS